MSVEKGRHVLRNTEREEPVRPRKKRIWLRILIGVLCVLLLIVGGAALFVNAKLNRMQRTSAGAPTPAPEAIVSTSGNEAKIKIDELEQRDSASEIPTDDIFKDKDVVNILLIGTDMKIPGTGDPGRADGVVICSLNHATGEVKLVGFERTIGMPVPDKEDEILSYIFQYGGGPFMQESVSKVFRVDLDGYVHIPYETFPAVIDAIGGIDIKLDQSEVYRLKRNVKVTEDLEPGMNHLGGYAAYILCHTRESDDDWARQGRVRNVIQAVFKQAKNLSLSDMNRIADEVLPLVDTNLTNSQIASLILFAPKFTDATVSQLMVPERDSIWYYQTGRGAYMLGCDYSVCAKNIREFLYGK